MLNCFTTTLVAKALWTPEAREDLKSIALYIGREDRRPATAAKIAREIKAKCDEYAAAFAEGSVIGTRRPELGENHRVFSHKRWVIIFRATDQDARRSAGRSLSSLSTSTSSTGSGKSKYWPACQAVSWSVEWRPK